MSDSVRLTLFDMGSFYTQILVREADANRCAQVMRELGRRSVVIPAVTGVSVVCDAETEDQDIDILDNVAMTLNSRLNCPPVGLVNHADELLILRYFEHGQFSGGLQIGHTPISLRGSVFRLRQLLNPSASLIDLIYAFISPATFQCNRHARLVKVLRLPPQSTGVGYHYIRTGNLPASFDRTGLIET